MSKMTTLCYLEKDGRYLMLHRVKKQNDENGGKWIGVGGHFEENESPEDCMKREIYEETGFSAAKWRFRGIVTFVSDVYPTEYMHLFTVTEWTGTQRECNEGVLEWIDKKELLSLPMWEGDKLFLSLIDDENTPFFSLKLVYKGEKLAEAEKDGEKIRI